MAGVRGARLRPALCITYFLSVRLGIRPEGKRGFTLMPHSPIAFLAMDWFRRPALPSPVWPEVQALDLPRDTLWVDGSGRPPNDSPFRVARGP
eukprot:2457117-Amphidinium_carterae.1